MDSEDMKKIDDIPNSIKQWKGVNIKDYQQRTRFLFPYFTITIC